MFVCMDVECILMPGSTNFNDISSPSSMVRTFGNFYRVAAAYVAFVMEGYVVCVHGCRMYFYAGFNQFQ